MTETPPTRIDQFAGEYAFLSNFCPANIVYEGVAYRTVEHAYQASKTTEPELRAFIGGAATAGFAKKLGQRVVLRPDWEQIKIPIMLDLLRLKFADPALRGALLATGNAKLIEGNWWGDNFWGIDEHGFGQNHLGQLLEQVRSEIREQLHGQDTAATSGSGV